MVVQKGKQGTKGQKQIIDDNIATLLFYRIMIIATVAIYFIVGMLLFTSFPTVDLVLLGFGVCGNIAGYLFMSSMAKPSVGAEGSVVDAGCDLNIEGGLAEHVKDFIILTSTCSILSAYSTYFWLFWLLVPGRVFQMLWTNILAPWIFQEAPPEEEELIEKKKRKMERKMKRY